MTSLIAWAALSTVSALGPVAESSRFEPEFTKPSDVMLQQSTVVLVTHASAHFDPLRQTKPAVDRVMAAAKRRRIPVVCFHDRHNSKNPAWLYLYDDWKPTAFVESDIGHYNFDTSRVRHVVCLGGFFWCCERNTLSDTIRHWRRDAPDQDLRITQVVDGIFDVAEGVVPPYRDRVRKFQADVLWKQYPQAAITLKQILDLIGDDESAVDFIKRQIPELPGGVNVTIDFFGERIPLTTIEKKTDSEISTPELVLAYRDSHSFLGRCDGEIVRQRRLFTLAAAVDEFIRWPQTLKYLINQRPKQTVEFRRELRSLVKPIGSVTQMSLGQSNR